MLYRTFPALNILLYNAVGASSGGDELYGIEPVSYYLRNLVLTMGPAAVVGALSPVGLVLHWSVSAPMDVVHVSAAPVDQTDGINCLIAIWFSGAMWLGLLFSRPHKEDRFLYPAYPAILLMTAVTVNAFVQTVFKYAWPIPAPQTVKQAVREASVNEQSQDRLSVANAQLDTYRSLHG